MLLWRDFIYVKILDWDANKSASCLYVYAPKVAYSTTSDLLLPLAFDVWASVTYFTPGSSYLFSLRQQYEYIFSVPNIF